VSTQRQLPLAARTVPRNPLPAGYVPFTVFRAGLVADIYIFDYIGGFGVNPTSIAEALKAVEGAEQLIIHINSPGGSVFDGWAIYAQLKSFPAAKEARVYGMAASMAVPIMLAADTRLISAQGQIMIHNPSGYGDGEAEDLRKQADQLDVMRSQMIDLMAAATAQDAAQIGTWMDEETWFTADEAIANGFATGLFEAPAMAAIASKFTPQASAQKGSPKRPMTELLTALGLPDTATEQEALAAHQAAVAAAEEAGRRAAQDEATSAQARLITRDQMRATVLALAPHIAAADVDAYIEVNAVNPSAAARMLVTLNTPVSAVDAIRTANAQASVASGAPAARAAWTFDDWDRKDPRGLEKLSKDNPTAFRALYRAKYGKDPK
jgi:ATP-dependent Clp protease, protease subunit